ncbi:MAG: hypothetical protein WCK75_09590 [Elusimicrobiota bacterium]
MANQLMPKHSFLKIATALLFTLAWLILSVLALAHYPGSKLIYSVFSIAFFCMLAGGLYKQDSYGYMFLTIFMWLGFWLKFTVGTIIGAKYAEAIGAFIPTPANLDNILGIAILAAFAVIVAGFLCRFIPGGAAYCSAKQDTCPPWYPRFRKWLWLGLWLCIILIPVVNTVLGINQIGLTPRTILHWPLNFLIAWFLGIGLSMGVVTLLWWDILAKRGPLQGLFAVLAEAAISSTSLLSRGTFLWHVLPAAAASAKNFKELFSAISKIKIFMAGCAAALLFAVSFTMANTMRQYFYSADVVSVLSSKGGNDYKGNNVQGLTLAIKGFSTEFKDFFQKASSMAIGRWIGVEGVMAVAAYPIKGRDTFLKALMEKRELGKADFYQSVCQSGVGDDLYFQVGSLPGFVAFLYYSGSLLVVFLGVLLLTLAIRLSEAGVGYLTGNPFMCSLWGLAAANTAAQLSAPRQMLPYFSAIICALIFIHLIQGGIVNRKT